MDGFKSKCKVDKTIGHFTDYWPITIFETYCTIFIFFSEMRKETIALLKKIWMKLTCRMNAVQDVGLEVSAISYNSRIV